MPVPMYRGSNIDWSKQWAFSAASAWSDETKASLHERTQYWDRRANPFIRNNAQ